MSFHPSMPKKRRTEAVVEQDGQRMRVMKGAVKTIAEAFGLHPATVEKRESRATDPAAKGYRM